MAVFGVQFWDFMRYLLPFVLLCTAFAEQPKSCLIIKHASVSHQLWVSGANWQYVEGDFPNDMKWKSNITDRGVRKIKENGGKVIIVPEKYSTADLQDARNQCKALTSEAKDP